MIVEERRSHCPRLAQVGSLSRRIAEPPISVSGALPSQPEHVVRSFRSQREEHNSKVRPRPLAAVVPPDSEHPVLVRFVPQHFRADAVLARRVERFGRIVDLEENIEYAATLLQLKVTVGLLTILPYLQREPAVSVGPQYPHPRLMRRN